MLIFLRLVALSHSPQLCQLGNFDFAIICLKKSVEMCLTRNFLGIPDSPVRWCEGRILHKSFCGTHV